MHSHSRWVLSLHQGMNETDRGGLPPEEAGIGGSEGKEESEEARSGPGHGSLSEVVGPSGTSQACISESMCPALP